MPGWHSTIFLPYFVARHLSGFAMVVTLAVPLRPPSGCRFHHNRHFDNMAKVLLATGVIVAYGYLMKPSWPGSHNPYEEFVQLTNRPFGPYAHTYWMMPT